jgi:hypothetical protein
MGTKDSDSVKKEAYTSGQERFLEGLGVLNRVE